MFARSRECQRGREKGKNDTDGGEKGERDFGLRGDRKENACFSQLQTKQRVVECSVSIKM